MYKQILVQMCAFVGVIIVYIYLINARIVDNITSLSLHQLTDVAQTVLIKTCLQTWCEEIILIQS